MGRTEPSRGAPPAALRRDARSKRAKATLNRDIPTLLKAYPRAQKGIETVELIVDPPPMFQSQRGDDGQPSMSLGSDNTADGAEESQLAKKEECQVQIHFEVADTLQVAYRLSQKSKTQHVRKCQVAILNMASPLRPGGGFLTGAQAQEETLCMRTTLYPSLREEFYRLPEVGAIYSRDVLVFRGWDSEMTDLDKQERFFIDVITAAMPRFPDTIDEEGVAIRYADPQDSELVERKMRALMRILCSKNIKRVVLGAWGCGAYKNPVDEVAKLWRKVLLGNDNPEHDQNFTRKYKQVESEFWGNMEIVFAINEPAMAGRFAQAFGSQLSSPEESRSGITNSSANQDQQSSSEKDFQEMQNKIAEIESQISQARNPELKARLEVVVAGLKSQSSQIILKRSTILAAVWS